MTLDFLGYAVKFFDQSKYEEKVNKFWKELPSREEIDKDIKILDDFLIQNGALIDTRSNIQTSI